MANLSITLELDNRGYITGIKASEDAIKRFGQSSQTATDQAARGMDRVSGTAINLSKNFDRLRNAVLGAAFLSFARSSLMLSEQIQDLAESTGLATVEVLRLQAALQASNVDSNAVAATLIKFSQSVEEATDRGSKAYKVFKELGISEQQLSKSSLPDLFLQTAAALEKQGKSTKSTADIVELYGKKAAQLDPEKFASEMAKVANSFEDNAESIRKNAEAAEKFKQLVFDLQIAFNEAVGPIVRLFSWLETKMPIINDLMKVFLATVIAIGAASGIRAFTAIIFKALDGVRFLIRAFQQLRGTLKPGTLASDALKSEAGKQTAEVMGNIGGAVVGAAAAGAYAYDAFNPQTNVVEQAAQQNAAAERAITGTDKQATAAEKLASRLDNLRDKVADIAKNYNQYSQELNDNLRMQEKHLGMSENQIEVDKAVADVRKEASRRIADYQTMLENLKKDEMGLAPIIKQQIENIRLRAQADETSVRLSTEKIQQYKESLEQLADAQELKNLRLGNEESLQSLQDEIDLVGLYGDQLEDQQALLAVTQELRSKLLGIQQEENDLILKKDQLGADAFNREMARLKALREEAYIYAEERLKLEEELIAKQRELSQDWQKELGKQLEDLADSISPARLAANMFGSVIRSVDDALTQFVEKGKFNFKEFARSLLRDMALIIARALIMRAILQAFGMAGFGPMAAGGSSAMALNYTGPQFGGFAANGGKVMPGKGYIVGERGPELFMPKAIGNIVPNNQLGMAAPSQTQVTYNINAVDAQSFRTLVARDPSFIFNVSEVGRRSSPARRLA